MKNIIVFDLEIKNVIDGENITWKDHAKMGISVGVTYSFATGDYQVFLDDNIEDLPKVLNEADVVTGFNILGFDIPLLEATTKSRFTNHSNVYDMLHESRLSTGWREKMQYPKGLRLDDHLRGTFGEKFMKTEDGANAPKMYQAGEMGRVISYCIADVRREAALFEHAVINNLTVNTENHGDKKWRTLQEWKPSLPIYSNGISDKSMAPSMYGSPSKTN